MISEVKAPLKIHL